MKAIATRGIDESLPLFFFGSHNLADSESENRSQRHQDNNETRVWLLLKETTKHDYENEKVISISYKQ